MRPDVRDRIVQATTLALAAISAVGGLAKLLAVPAMAAQYDGWGLPVWFMQVVGMVEVAAAALLIWPVTAPAGAVMLVSLALGGVVARNLNGEHGLAMVPAFLLGLAMLVAWAHPRPSFAFGVDDADSTYG